jgi:hypothetical protein
MRYSEGIILNEIAKFGIITILAINFPCYLFPARYKFLYMNAALSADIWHLTSLLPRFQVSSSRINVLY